MMEKIIAIDFDGVIHDDFKGYHDGTIYGDIIKGAFKALQHIHRSGHKIIIFTAKCRADRPLVNGKTGGQLVLEWLNRHGVAEYVFEVTGAKPEADYYIDNKGIKFENWEQTLKDIKVISTYTPDNYFR